ncbi:MAG: hypothetical protein RML12_02115 [Xanthomonadales bacterium]|nr:hypothetical protein [Xanthomonadales bacterium]
MPRSRRSRVSPLARRAVAALPALVGLLGVLLLVLAAAYVVHRDPPLHGWIALAWSAGLIGGLGDQRRARARPPARARAARSRHRAARAPRLRALPDRAQRRPPPGGGDARGLGLGAAGRVLLALPAAGVAGCVAAGLPARARQAGRMRARSPGRLATACSAACCSPR